MRVAPLFGLAIGLGVSAGAGAQPGETPPARPRPRLALALSGGGARGIAHIGALRALEEAGLPIDAIAANSMGAIVGALHAAGRNSVQIEQAVRSLEWGSLFSGRPDRRVLPVARRSDRHGSLTGLSFDYRRLRFPRGLLSDHRVNRFLIGQLAAAGYAAGGDFDALPIPFRAVATDLATGEPVVLARGDLALAVRASMSIPLVFGPVDWHGRTLVDGMFVSNLPCDVAKGFDPLVLVAVDVASSPLEPSEYETALGVAAQINDLLTLRRNRDFQHPADVTIRPDLGKHRSTDYTGFERLVRRGYEAARAAVPRIRERLRAAGVSDLEPRNRSAGGPQLEGARIVEVTVEGNESVRDGLVRRIFNIPVGAGYEMARGLRAFDKIEASGLLDRTWLEFVPQGDGVRVQLRAGDAPPNRAEVGVGFSEWERAHASARLLNQNTLGFGEQLELLAAASDALTLGQFALRGDRLFVPGLGYRAAARALVDKPRFFDEGGREVNRARFVRQEVELALRSSLERWGLLEAGLRFGRVETRPRAGVDWPSRLDRAGVVFGGFTLDDLDVLEWPDDGQRLAALGEWSSARLGAERAYWRASLEARLARPLGRRFSVQLDALLGLSGRDLPAYDWYRTGGPMLVPGYHAEELKGAQVVAAAASLRFRPLRELRVFARAGTGDVFASRREMSLQRLRWGVALGAYHPTPIGPIAVELGVRDGGTTLVSLVAGWN